MTKGIWTNHQGEELEAEIVPYNDKRVDKIMLLQDIYVWFPDLGWGNTYDPEVVEKHFKEKV